MATNPIAFDAETNMVELYTIEAALLIACIAIAGVALGKGKAWAADIWFIPVLVALLWGCLKEKNTGSWMPQQSSQLLLPSVPQLGV